MSKPIIFLDFDGVLNTDQYQAKLALDGQPAKDNWGPLFDPRSVTNLHNIVDATDACIVITSSWRFIHGLDGLRSMWQERQLPNEIYDVLPYNFPNTSHNTILNTSRGEEIDYYLKSNPTNSYVIIDDLNDFTHQQHSHFVETNPIVGLTKNQADKAIEILST